LVLKQAARTLVDHFDQRVALCEQRRGPLPYLPGLRVPYYLFVGRKR
jgi:hypothetical protein